MTAATWFAAALVAQIAAALLPIRWPAASRAALLVLAGAQTVVAATGLVATLGHPWSLGLGHLLGYPTVLAADPLSGMFLTLTGVVAACSCLVAASPVGALAGPRAVSLAALLVLAVSVTISATDAFVLVLAWETISFTFFALSAHRGTTVATRSGLLAFFFGKSSGALLLVGLLLPLTRGSGIELSDLARPLPTVLHGLAYALLVLAFGVKVGLVPVHVWMPPAYEAAPASLRPLMAGVAVNVGFYGLWRTIDLLGAPPAWLVITILLLAALTGILGIAHASVQTRLPRVIAWSSVENAGLITVGLGVALVGARTDDARLVAVGLLAGTLQAVAHAFAKALLFASSATIESVGRTGDINHLRGALWRSPFSGTGFVVGCLTLAALPPTAGFVSEWFLLESLMQQFRIETLAVRLALALTGALVALTAGFAGVAFVRLVGFVAFGDRPPPSQRVPTRDVGLVGRVGLVGLVLGCLGVAAVTPLEIAWISHGLSPVVPRSISDQALAGHWVVQPVFAGFSALSPSFLWIVMPGFGLLVFGLSVLASRGRLLRVRRVNPWLSASADIAAPTSYTAFGFANPTRKVLANVLLTRSRLVALERSSGGQVGDEARGPAGAHLGYTSDVVEIVERFFYRPLRAPLLRLVRTAKRLQSGRLDAYITYMLFAVLAMLALVVAWK